MERSPSFGVGADSMGAGGDDSRASWILEDQGERGVLADPVGVPCPLQSRRV